MNGTWIVVFADVFNFLQPASLVNCEDLWESLLVVLWESVSVDSTLFWHEADWCVNAVVFSVTAVEDPSENA